MKSTPTRQSRSPSQERLPVPFEISQNYNLECICVHQTKMREMQRNRGFAWGHDTLDRYCWPNRSHVPEQRRQRLEKKSAVTF